MKKLTKDQLDLLFVIENMVLDLTDENEENMGHTEFNAYMKVSKMLRTIRNEDMTESINEYEARKKVK